MKKTFLSSLICLMAVHAWALTTITTGKITGNPFCGGETISVPYTVDAPADSGNVFTAQLSDATGSFIVHYNIGYLSATGSGTITATIPFGTKSGTKYRIRVVSSAPLLVGSINTKNLRINPKPGETTLTGITACSATLNWNAPATAASFKVRYRKTGDPEYGAIINVGNVTSYTFANLAANTSYDFQVRSVCANGDLSNWRKETASTVGCGVPTGGVETGNTPVSITYDWNNTPCATGYRIRTRITGDPDWELFNSSTFSTTTINGLYPATDYESQIAAICGTDTGEYSASIFGNTTYRLAASADGSVSFGVFPNPSNGEFSLQFNGAADNTSAEITIENVYGQTIYSAVRNYYQGLNEEKISIPNAASGMYLVKVKSGGETLEATMMVK
ncbi:MAG TPA: fibronectin type III domain-containing protein [Chitinophagales bacterium]|nr:fibronectin type III domain-containing protein [Chitinophagales bacterium]